VGVIENIHLLSQLRKYASDLEKRVAERTEELYASRERISAILASVGDGVVVTDLSGNILMINQAFEYQSGYEENEMAPVRDQFGQIVSYVGSQRDITRKKELERLKDMFVADVSHELRTPTTNINLYLELLENASPEKREKYINILKEEGGLLARLVEDILDLSRLTMGKTKKIEFEQVNLNLLVEQIATAHQPVIEASGNRLLFIPDPQLPNIMGEQNQLSRLINNLVSNATRYTKDGSITIKTYQQETYVVLMIEDTGVGIDAEDMEHIFERFYRGKNVRQSNIHGTGLGLAIVQEIVDIHNGYIDVKSQPGKGTTFRIFLPIQHKENNVESSPSNPVVLLDD